MSLPDATDDLFGLDGRLRSNAVTPAAANALQESVRLARVTRWDSLRSPHVFMGLLAAPDMAVRNWGDRLGADLGKLLRDFQELFLLEEGETDALLLLHREFLSDNVLRLLREAQQRAHDQHRKCIAPIDLLISLLTAPHSIVADCFKHIGVSVDRLTELAFKAEQHARSG
jgi:ATP-dependent Clp protease ATP-binding subunit ClpA